MNLMKNVFACIATVAALVAEAGMRDLQSEIDAAAESGGGVVKIGPGEHETKPFSLKSNVTLDLAEGATILASTNIADYAEAFGKRCFIYAEDATNIAIVGGGTIDGRGYAFKELKNLPGASQPQALPVMMRFSRCRNVLLEGFTYRQAGAWGCHLRNCDGATLRRLKCFNHVNNTNDGIDIESANVTIEDCDIDSDDDAIAFKTESDKSFAVTNVTIRNCRIASCCSAVKFGTGSYSDVRDVKIENCSLVRSKLNHRFKWWKIIPGVETNSVTGLAGLALEVVDGGRMENVTVRNLTMDGYHVPIFVRMNRRHPPPQGMKTYLRNILIENVRGTSSSRIACSITGIPGMRPSDITIRNVRLAFLGGGTAADSAAVVPEKEKAYPECCMFDKMPLPAYAFYVRHADSVVFEDVDVWTMQPDERRPFVFDDCTDCARRNTSTGAKRFSIGTYCLPKGMTEDQVADLKACGIDTVFFAKDSAAVQPILAKYGIREVMRSVDYIRKPHLVKNLETDGRRLRTEIAAGHHPAFGGLDVYDEPNAAILPRIGDVATRLQTATGGLPMYVNLYPEYVFGASMSVSEEKRRIFGANSYDEYIDLYCRNVPLDHISYDFYLYSLSPSALPKFYDNFRIVADACRRTGRSLRFVGQVNSANPKVWISENMLRYQAFAAMAFGAEAVSWGCWSAGWYTNQVLDAQGRKTQQYDKLKKVNGEILTIASEYMRFRNVATSFVGFPKGCNDLKGIPDEPVAWFDDDFVRGLSAEDGDRLVVGAMLPRSGNAAERAYFVLAADDPCDKAPRERTVRFKLPDGLSAKVVGGSGIVAPTKAADGTLRFPLVSSAGALVVVSKCEGGNVRDLWSDTWDAIDGLGRGTERADLPAPREKKVGIFYWTWHQGGFAGEAPFNNAKFLAENPGIEGKYDDPRWGRTWRRHHWDEPLFGYYRTTDKWVLRRHAQMLSAAGVDTVVFDSTNATYTWLDSLHALGETWCEMRREGNATPQFAYMLPFGKKPAQIVMLLELYRKIYKPGKFKELWFAWNGKPLVHACPQVLEAAIADPVTSEEDRRDLKEILGFFTFRPLQPSYTAGPQSDDQWTWLEVYPQHPCGPKADGGYEMCSAGVAQNHTWKGRDGHNGIAAMNDINVLGRAYVAPDEKDLAPGEKLRFAADRNPRRGEQNRFLWGDNFAQQMRRAREIDPDYLFVTGWNEWIADMMPKWNGIKNAFPDQFSPEFSRDIEPSAGILKDNYYCQLVQELRRFRGARRQKASDENPIYRDAIGDTAARDSQGYWKIRYSDKSGRNDIVECFVSHDAENVTFRAECAAPITPHTDKSWMRLFVSVALDPDDRRPNWNHFHFAVNRVSPPDGRTAVLESCEGGWKWREVAHVHMEVEGKSLTLVLPRKALGLDKGKVNLWFKWSDNSIGENGDVLDFYRRGDAAPDGRFLYRYFERGEVRGWRVAEQNGAPGLYFGERPVAPVMFWQWEAEEEDAKAMASADVKLFGIFGSVGHYSRPYWRKDGFAGMAYQDEKLDQLLSWVPDAAFLPRVFAAAPQWWIDANPDEQIRYSNPRARPPNRVGLDGSIPRESFASEKCRRELGAAYREAVRHLYGRYGRHLLGIHLANGPWGENFAWDALVQKNGMPLETAGFSDVSSPMTERFRRYLREKYGDEARLRDAWKDASVSFATAEVPPMAARLALDEDGVWRDPAKGRRVPDYFECMNAVTVEMLNYYGGIVKDETDLPVLAFYGYTQDERWAIESDHRAVSKIYRLKNVDMFSAPHTYHRRSPGEDGSMRCYLASAALHGKFFLDEGDDMTHLEQLKKNPDGRCSATNAFESVNLLYREFGMAVTHGTGLWYMDLMRDTFRSPELVAAVGRMRKAADLALAHDRSHRSEVAVVSNVESEFYMGYRGTDANAISEFLYRQQMGAFYRAGAPFDWYLAEDLDAVVARNYKVVVFLDCQYMTEQQRKQVEALKAKDRTLVFFHAPGYVSEMDLSRTRIEAICGVKTKPGTVRGVLSAVDAATGREWGCGLDHVIDGVGDRPRGVRHLKPGTVQKGLFLPDEGETLMTGVGNLAGTPVAVRKAQSGWTTVFSALPALAPDVLRNLYREAGVHVYTDEDVVLSANSAWLMLHTRKRGDYAVRLPRRARMVLDVTNGEVVARDCDRFTCELEKFQTAVYLIEE